MPPPMNAEPIAAWIAWSSLRYSLAEIPVGSPRMMPTPSVPLSVPCRASSARAVPAIASTQATVKAKRMVGNYPGRLHGGKLPSEIGPQPFGERAVRLFGHDHVVDDRHAEQPAQRADMARER